MILNVLMEIKCHQIPVVWSLLEDTIITQNLTCYTKANKFPPIGKLVNSYWSGSEYNLACLSAMPLTSLESGALNID